MWRVVTDSTMDLPETLTRSLNITVVPIHIHFGEETYLDRQTIDEATFYHLIETRGEIPKTSQPSVGEFVEVYRDLARETDAILSLHISSRLSGTHASALQAAALVAEDVPVTVFDSQSGSAGLGFMAMEAARMAQAGVPLPEAVEHLSWMRQAMRIYLMLDNLKFAQMSGRVTFVQHMMASMLRLKPIVTVRDGLLEPADRVRTRQRAMERLVDLVAAEYGHVPVHIAVVHARASAWAEELLRHAQARLNVASHLITPLSTAVAVHLGPGTVGIVAYPAQKGGDKT